VTPLAQHIATLKPDAIPDFFNPAKSAFQLALDVLDARILEAEGKLPEAIAVWQKAVALNDSFTYNEPADWYYPVRDLSAEPTSAITSPPKPRPSSNASSRSTPATARALYGLWQAQLAHTRQPKPQIQKPASKKPGSRPTQNSALPRCDASSPGPHTSTAPSTVNDAENNEAHLRIDCKGGLRYTHD